MPAVSSAMRAPPSLPRSATMSVAPKARAISWRDSWRDMAITRSAPIWEAASTPHSPTAPSPITTAVPPGRTPAVTAACQPVAITSDRASSEGISESSGRPSVLTRLPSAWVTREYSPWPLAVKPRLSHTDCTPARQCAQVLSQWQNGTMTKSPTAKSLTSRADLLDDSDALVADRRPGVDVVVAAVGPQVRAADASRDHLHDRVGGLLDGRVGDLLEADVAGCVDRRGSHGCDPATAR